MRSPKKRITQLLLAAVAVAWAMQPALGADKQVTIAYQLMVNPWKVAIVDKAFEKATGYDIKWVQFSSGAEAARGLAAGAVEMTSIGSVPLTTAISNGVPAKMFWVLEDIAANEALVVRDGAGIKTIADLEGKRIGVPVGSTTDLHLYQVLTSHDIDARVLDMQPDAIAAAWVRGDIDAAFVWDPALSQILKTGSVLIHSGQICKNSGVCTFDALAVNTEWAEENPQFMVDFVKQLNEITARYVHNTEKWTPDSPMVQKITQLNGADPQQVPQVLDAYNFPLAEEQASKRWLKGGAIDSIAQSAKFLQQRGVVSSTLDDYSEAVTAKWVEQALAEMAGESGGGGKSQ